MRNAIPKASLVPSRGSYRPIDYGARCDICPLAGRHDPVPPATAGTSPIAIAANAQEALAIDTKSKTKLIILGEGPGRVEIHRGIPFQGPSGKLLESMLEKAGFDRKDAHITNAALCRGETDYEKDRAAACCAPRLASELTDLPSAVPILTLGAPAMKVMLGRASILKTRGFVWKVAEVEKAKLNASAKRLAKRTQAVADNPKDTSLKDGLERSQDSHWRLEARAALAGRIVIPAIHPAMILRGSDGWLPVLSVDVDRAVRWAKKPFKLYDDGPFETAKTARELEKLLGSLRTKEILIDIETDGVDPLRAKMLMLGLSEIPDYAGKKRPLAKGEIGPDDIRIVLASPWRRDMAPLLTEFFQNHTAVGHNIIHFDEIALDRHHVEIRGEDGVVEDSLIAHHVYASHLRQGLDHVVSVYCDAGPWKINFKSSGAEEKGVATFSMLNKGNLDKYNAADVRLNAIAWRRMQADLDPERAVYRHDLQLARICQQMRVIGFKIDTERQEELSLRMRGRYAALLGEMRKIAGPKFHPARTHDLRRIIFGRFKVPAIKATPTGLASTDSGVLEALRSMETRAGHLSDLILRGRATAKMRSTYVEALEVDPKGRTHTEWKSYGTPNGRFSGKIQTLPRLTWTDKAKKLFKQGKKPKEVKALLGHEAIELEARIREMYVAEPGWELVYFDLRQSEMRMAAYVANDEEFIKSCESGDVHSANACILFPAAAEDIRLDKDGRGKQWRDITKNVGFGIIYLAEINTIFEFLHAHGFTKVTMKDVEAAFAIIYKTYKRYYQYCEERLAECKKQGYLRTYFTGRRRFLSFYPKPSDVANFCLDKETEALTRRGWVKGLDLRPGDSLLTKREETGELEWHAITRMTVRPNYRDELVEFKSASFHAVSTPDHRWLVTNKRGENEWLTTDEVIDRKGHVSIHRTGSYRGAQSATYTDDFVELAGWVLTDGHISKGRVGITQSNRGNPHKVKQIDALMRRLGLEPWRRESKDGKVDWVMNKGTEVVHILRRLFMGRLLTLEFLLTLTARQLSILFDAMMAGDGHRSKAGDFFLSRSKQGADAFAVLCTLLGRAASVTWKNGATAKAYPSMKNRPVGKGGWVVYVLRRTTAQVMTNKKPYGRQKAKSDHVRRFRGNGDPVWCPTVRNSCFVARRDGKVFITGNCVQPNIADIMNLRMLEIVKRYPRDRRGRPQARLVAQIHDAMITEVRKGAASADTLGMIRDVWEAPIVMPHTGRQWVMPIDDKIAERWSDLG